MVQRGYAIDWNRAKRDWKDENVTDAKLFEEVVSVYPSAIQYLTSDNLRLLLKIGSESLARQTAALKKNSRNASDNTCAFYIACWKLYCIEPKCIENPANEVHTYEEQLDLFVWASLFAYNMVDVHGPAEVFQATLQNHIVELARRMVITSEKVVEKFRKIYSHFFAPLLKIGENGIPYV